MNDACRDFVQAYVDAWEAGTGTVYLIKQAREALCKPADAILAHPSVRDGEALSDPTAVHLNMLRGGIAKPTPANIWHLYGDKALLDAMPASARDGEVERLREQVEMLTQALAEAVVIVAKCSPEGVEGLRAALSASDGKEGVS